MQIKTNPDGTIEILKTVKITKSKKDIAWIVLRLQEKKAQLEKQIIKIDEDLADLDKIVDHKIVEKLRKGDNDIPEAAHE